MLRRLIAPVSTVGICVFLAAVSTCSLDPISTQGKSPAPAISKLNLQKVRISPLDLELGGDLSGLPAGSVRYVTRESLLTLPQVNCTVTDDANFAAPIQIRGIELNVLAREFAPESERALVEAVSKDLYRGHYPRSYIQAHHPVLVLEINGQPPAGWPKSREGSGSSMGPYLISHAHSIPSFEILAHEDEPQIPWGVVRLEFRNEEAVLRTIAPLGPQAQEPMVQDGYGIAQQNCWRCHAPESEGATKGKLTWEGIGLVAALNPRPFADYVRNPQKIAQDAEMPANPNYDDATMLALISYFRTFFTKAKP